MGFEDFGRGNVGSELGTIAVCALIGAAIIFLGIKLYTIAWNISVNKAKKQLGRQSNN